MRAHAKSIKGILAILLVITTILAVGTVAFFADRVTHQMKFATASFTKDGYTLARTAPNGPFVAGEDVTFTLKESNTKDEDIASVVTITVKWDSPDKTCSIFGNQNTQDNATITIGGKPITYTLNADGTITFDVPEHVLRKGTKNQETAITLHIPESLQSTGDMEFTFDKVIVGQHPNGFTAAYDRTDLNAAQQLDFSVKVGWAAGDPTKADGKAIMGYLTAPDADGKYGIGFEMAFGYTKCAMRDLTYGDVNTTAWQYYSQNVSTLNLCEGMTTIGDYAFGAFAFVDSVTIPSTVTGIGEYAFYWSGLEDTVTIPKNVIIIERNAFGQLPNVDTFIFEHGANDTLTLPDNTSSGNEDNGAFALPSDFVETTVVTKNEDIKYGYNWFNDNRRGIPVLAAQDRWYTQGGISVNRSAVTSVAIKDIYEPSSYAYSWDASEPSYYPGTVTAYLEETGSGQYRLTLAGNGYGSIMANANSCNAFQGFNGITGFTGADVLSLSGVADQDIPATTTLEGMFNSCSSLKSIDVSSWDVSKVTTTSYMFMDCNALQTLDLSAWETDCLANTSFMFSHTSEGGAGILRSINLTGWDTKNVTQMQGMFFGNPVLTEIKGLNGFNTAKVTNMNKMFMCCYALPSVDVSGFVTSSVKDMGSMFQNCRSITALDISSFNTTGIADKSKLNRFAYGCTSLTTITLGETFGQAGMIPSAGSNTGMFYVPSYLKTTINGANAVMKVKAYDWVTDNRWKVGVSSATLAYDDVLVGETVDPQLKLLPVNYDECQSIQYEVITGSQYAKVNKDTGVVTGLKKGTATIRVTIVDANGDTITAVGTVNVYYIGITDATLDYDDVRVGETVDPQLKLLPDDCDDYQSIKYEVISGGKYAEVDEDTGVVTGLVPGEATIRVTIIDANGDKVTADGTVTVYAIGITSATLKYNDVRVDETVDPQLQVLPTNRDPDKSKSYAIIAGSDYAKINATTGVVTGLKPGTATVRVTIVDANGKTVTADATVKVYAVGATSATLAYNDVRVGNTVNPQTNILPTDREPDKSVTYAVISGGEYAKVDASTGVVTGLAPGTATVRVTVTDANGKQVTADGTVKVYAVGATSATLAYNDVRVGKTVNPQYQILPTDRDPDKSMTFSIISGSEYAKVNASTGVVTGLAPGTATVRLTVTDANGTKITADGPVKVYAVGATSATLAYNDVQVGKTVDPKYQILPADRDPDKSMTFSIISGGEYAKVDASTGVVTGLKPGTATVRVTVVDANGKTVTADGTVHVYAVGVTSATLEYDDVNVGETVNPQLQILPTVRDTDKSVSYSVISGGTYAKVDPATGVVTGLKAGEATIRVTIVDANGKTVTADATVTVIHPIPVLAWQNFWYTQGTVDIDKTKITSITFVDEIDAATKTAAGENYWDASDDEVGTVYAYAVPNSDGSTYALTVAGNGYGCIYANENSRYAFSGYENLTEIVGTDILDTSNVTNMYQLFAHNYAMTDAPDVSTWETGEVTTMANMFQYCHAMVSPPNTTNWDTSNVEDMSSMFYGCYVMLTPPDTSKWDTSKVTEMTNMFHSCWVMQDAPNTSKWDTSQVTDMYNMFFCCYAMDDAPVTTDWDVGLVDNMNYMFNACHAMTAPPDTSKWNTESLTTAYYMFASCYSMTEAPVTTNWKTSLLKDCSCMFIACESMTTAPDLSKWDLSSLVTIDNMFNGCTVMAATPDMRAWDTSNIQDMQQMFLGCEAITTLDVSSFDTSNVYNEGLQGFAMKCYNLTTIILGPNFGQTSNIPIPGPYDLNNADVGGIFFVDKHSSSSPLNTYVTGANDAMMAYEWIEDCRGYEVDIAFVTGGNLDAEPHAAINGVEITLTATPETGYTYLGATMTYTDENGNTKTIELAADDFTFIMPAANVDITPKWQEN